MFGTLVLVVASTRKGVTILSDKKLSYAILLMSILLVLQVLTGRGFVVLAAGGYVLAFTLAFYGLFYIGTGIAIKTIVRGISFLYKFFIAGMMIETLIIILGKQPLLRDLLSPTNTLGYKTYNQADIPRMFGFFQDVGGLNSVLLGSQIAGMLSLFATIWFVGVRKSKLRGAITVNSGLWVFFSFLMLLFSINGTVLLMLILAIFIYFLFIWRKHRAQFLCIMSLFCFGLYLAISQGLLLERIFSDELALSVAQTQDYADYGLHELEGINKQDYYVFTFLNPVYIWNSLDWINKLIGVGAQLFLSDTIFVGGDFGFGSDVLLKSGLVWAVAFVATIFYICFPALKLEAKDSYDRQLWPRLASINALISLLWLFSTVHYPQALGNTGGIMLFGWHLA